MRTSSLFDHSAATGTAKSLNGIILALFHLGRILIRSILLDDWHVLATMYAIWGDGMATEIRDGLDCGRASGQLKHKVDLP